MLGTIVFPCSFASIGELVAGVQVTDEDKGGSMMLAGQLQASIEERP